MSSAIHPTAIIAPDAVLGDGVSVGPYAVIEGNTVLGNGTSVGHAAHVAWGTRLGDEVKVFPHAVIGTVPQDLKLAARRPPSK